MGEITVNLVVEDTKFQIIPYTEDTYTEDVCISVCKKLKIGPLARHLFGLRITGESVFLMPGAKIIDLKHKHKKMQLDFRVRFKMPDFDKLSKIDAKAYDYLFYQVRTDILENSISELTYESSKNTLSGLAVMDMYRYLKQKSISSETVLKDYKKFLPYEVFKQHNHVLSKLFLYNLKRKLDKLLEQMINAKVDYRFVIRQYVNQLLDIAPNYLVETYTGKMQLRLGDDQFRYYPVSIRICPKDGIQYSTGQDQQKNWETIGHITDISTISLAVSQAEDEYTARIHHKNEKPSLIWFNNEKDLYSFTSALDGYFRLIVDWTMNICKEVRTPSLKKMKEMRCHAPVGGEYSYNKLKIKMEERKTNCYLIRECESSHDYYYIDVCVKNSKKPSSFKIQKTSDNHYIFEPDQEDTKYESIADIVKAYSDPNGNIFLEECIRFPVTPETSQVLLCKSDSIVGDSLYSTDQVSLPSGPVCINKDNLQQFKASKRQGAFTSVYKGMWKCAPGKKIEVAIKVLEDSNENYLKDYLNLIGQWAFLENPAIVKLHGIYLTNTASLWQWCQHGSLDEYLKNNRMGPDRVELTDLVKAAVDMASALFYLSEKKLVHGKIRCRKIMVHSTPLCRFIVRLADPGIRTYYAPSDIHWLPVESYANPTHTVNQEYVKKSIEADVWALATTYYEIFSWGATLDTKDVLQHMKWYKSGERLKKPQDCPDEIFRLMRECWIPDPYKRKHPQELLRDINNYYYNYVIQSDHKKKNMYSVIGPVQPEASAEDSASLCSMTYDERANLLDDAYGGSIDSSFILDFSETGLSSDSTCLSMLTVSEALPATFELGSDWNVTLEGKPIGTGNFAEVYKGRMEPYIADLSKPCQDVAVKKLKRERLSALNMADFEREIHIMTELKHENIVRILNVEREPDLMLVMEFVENGSLDRYLSANKDQLTQGNLLKFCLDIASGMEYLGSRPRPIVHRDLAARNVLVKERDLVKISDFGLAQFISPHENYYRTRTKTREIPFKWYAIESLRFQKYSVKTDVWSYGVTLCEIFQYGQQPVLKDAVPAGMDIEDMDLFIQALEEGKRYPRPPQCAQDIWVELITPCWNKGTDKRPSFTEIKKKIEEIFSTKDIM